MEINGIGSVQMLTGVYGMNSISYMQEDSDGSQYALGTEQLDISFTGKLMSAISEMSEEERAEMRNFHQEIMEAVANGTFDASDLADDAPEALVSFAEENGVDLTRMIEDMAAGAGQRGGPPPPPPMLSGMEDVKASFFEDLSEEEQEEMETFLQEMMDSMISGSFNASELAVNAPDALVSYAEENDIDLEQMIQNIAEGPEKGGGTPPPPWSMYDEVGSILSFSEDMDSDLIGRMFPEEEDEDTLSASRI